MWSKLLTIWKLIRKDAGLAWFALRHSATPTWFKAGVIGLLIYFISPIDLIPGDLLTGFGIVDDLVLVPMALAWLVSKLPIEVRSAFHAR